MNSFFTQLKILFNHWSDDKVSTFSAALAYYTLFAIAPFFIICITLIGLIFGKEAAQGEILNQIVLLVGKDGASQIQLMIESANKPAHGVVTGIISFLVFIFGAAGAFAELQSGLNNIWKVKSKENQGLLHLFKNKFLSITVMLGLSFLSLVSLIFTVVLNIMSNYLHDFLTNELMIMTFINFLISLGVITLLFAMIFKILPDVTLSWSDVKIGAFITALLFTGGKYLLGKYLQTQHFNTAFGPAGSIIIILLWVYYSAQILFIGAEITKMYTTKN